MMTTILTTIWLSDSLREGEHLCFLTFSSPQEKFHFWIVHDRVLPVLSHSLSSSPLNIRLLLSGPLGAKIPQHLTQEKTEIMGWPEAHSCLQPPPSRTFPYHCTGCLPLPLSSTVVSMLSPAVLCQKEVGESGWIEPHLLFSKPARNLGCGQKCSPRSVVMDQPLITWLVFA